MRENMKQTMKKSARPGNFSEKNFMFFGDDNSYEQSHEHRRLVHRPETGNAFAALPSRLVNAYGDPSPIFRIGYANLGG